MMIAIVAAMARLLPTFGALRRRWLQGLTVLLTTVVGGGCSLQTSLPNVIYVAVGTSSDQTVDAELVREFQTRLQVLADGYRQLQPNTHFQFAVYPEERMAAVLRHRNGAGLGPDLVLVNGGTAQNLLRAGLIDPYPGDKTLLNNFDPKELQRLFNHRGQLSGLPMLLQTQLACFNRQRLSQPPASLKDLLVASASGHPIGLIISLRELFWSVGSQGALQSIEAATAGRALTTEERQRITTWLAWLQAANAQQRITFYPNQATADAEFLAGRLDWIPCRSTSLPRLRQALGPALGVAPLPAGEGGQASPINPLRTWALGPLASSTARERALAFTRFSVNPLTQRTITLSAQTVLPANRFVRVPVRSSAVLAAMETAAQQGRQNAAVLRIAHSGDPRLETVQTLLSELIFGEITPQATADRLVAALRPRP